MYRSGLVNMLVTHANVKGLGLTPLFGDQRGFMPPYLKKHKKQVLLSNLYAVLLPTIASGSFFHVFLGIFVEGVSRRRLPSYNEALLQLQPSAAAAAADGRKVLVGTILHRAQVFDLLVQLYLPTRLRTTTTAIL